MAGGDERAWCALHEFRRLPTGAVVLVHGLPSEQNSRRTNVVTTPTDPNVAPATNVPVVGAVGATQTTALKLVFGEGMRLTAVGLTSGIVAGFLATRAMRGLLYGIGASDPITFVGVTLLVTAVAFTASYLPARRAAHVDPTDALRGD